MEQRGVITTSLATIGTILAWTPLVAPIAFGASRLMQSGRLRIDYLMPAEMAPVAFVAGALLLWAAIRARTHRAPVVWSISLMAGLLVASMVAATLTGIASGAAPATGWRIIVAFGLIAGYTIALGALAVTGVLLVIRVARRPAATAGSS